MKYKIGFTGPGLLDLGEVTVDVEDEVLAAGWFPEHPGSHPDGTEAMLGSYENNMFIDDLGMWLMVDGDWVNVDDDGEQESEEG